MVKKRNLSEMRKFRDFVDLEEETLVRSILR